MINLQLPDPSLVDQFEEISAAIEYLNATTLKGIDGKDIEQLQDETQNLKKLGRLFSETQLQLTILRRMIHEKRTELQGAETQRPLPN